MQGGAGCAGLQTLGPAAGVVIDAQDLQHIVANSIGNDEGRFRNNELARSRYATGMTEFRIF